MLLNGAYSKLVRDAIVLAVTTICKTFESRKRVFHSTNVCRAKGAPIQALHEQGIILHNEFQHLQQNCEIVRNVVESQRLSTLIDYATAAPFAIDFLETAAAIEDRSNGIWR